MLVVLGFAEAWRLICVNLSKFWLVGAVGGVECPFDLRFCLWGNGWGGCRRPQALSPVWYGCLLPTSLKRQELNVEASCEFGIMSRVRKTHLMRLFGRASHRYAQ